MGFTKLIINGGRLDQEAVVIFENNDFSYSNESIDDIEKSRIKVGC